MIIKRTHTSDFVAYLSQFDLHNHSFSHCVFTEQHASGDGERKNGAWSKTAPSLDEKVDFIVQRLKSTMQAAVGKGVRVLAFTEHPQYTFYNVPYPRYRHIFNSLRRQFEGFIDKVVWGLELDLEMAKDRKPFVNEDIIGSNVVGPRDALLWDADVIVGSLHLYRDWRGEYLPRHQREQIVEYNGSRECIRDRDDYFELTMNALSALGEFRRQQQVFMGRPKTYVYGHPWGAAWMVNKRQFEIDHNRGEWIKMRREHPLYAQMMEYQWGPAAPVQFFTRDQLAQVADAHIEHGIYPEVNCRYIDRGASEYCAQGSQDTLLGVYAERCAARNTPAYISVCSDAHGPGELQKLNWRELAKRIPLSVQVWAETIS